MSILVLLVLLIIGGLLLWLVNNFIPMDGKVKQLFNAVVIIILVAIVIFWLLSIAGLVDGNLKII